MSNAPSRRPSSPVVAAPPSPPRAQALGRVRIVDPDGIAREVDVDLAESPLAWLRSRRDRNGEPMVDDRQFAAGERFRRDHDVAGLVARTTMNWEAFTGSAERRASGAGGGLLITEAAMAARERVARAVAAVGPDLSGVLVAVCCEHRGLADVERDHDWPSRSAKVVLRLALDALARHYGLDAEARGPQGSRSRHWGAEDYRPKP